MQFKNNDKNFKILYVIIILISILSICLVKLTFDTIKINSEKSTELIAKGLMSSFQELITENAKTYSKIANREKNIFGKNKKRFEEIAKSEIEIEDSLNAFNWIDDDTTITWVYPHEKNKSAIGKKIKDHPELGPIIVDKMLEGKITLTPVVKTFQGYYAFILYIPIHDQKLTWLNIVINFESWFKHFFEQRNLKDIYVRFSWKDSTKSFYEFGIKPKHNEYYTNNFIIYGQNIELKLAYSEPHLIQLKNKSNYIQITILGLLLLLIFVTRNAQLKNRKNQQLKNNLLTKNGIINSLTHDLANPLQLLVMAQENNHLPQDKIKTLSEKGIKRISEIINLSRDIFKDDEIGNNLIQVNANVQKMIDEAIFIVLHQANKKNINILNLVDENSSIKIHIPTFINHIICNLLTNAIKFSNPDSKIEISDSKSDDLYHLYIKDWGVGFKKQLTSSTGTIGEQGHGLGLKQVEFFLNLFNARIYINSDIKLKKQEEPTTIITLEFKV